MNDFILNCNGLPIGLIQEIWVNHCNHQGITVKIFPNIDLFQSQAIANVTKKYRL